MDIINDDFSKLGYFLMYKNRKKISRNCSGGILVLVRAKYRKLCKEISTNNNSCLWFRINKSVFGYDKDILCAAVYLPPENSKYSDIGIFDDFVTDLITLNPNNDYYVLMIGDFNSRVYPNNDFVTFDYELFEHANLDDAMVDSLLEEDTLQGLGIPCERVSLDKKANNYGKKLIELCKSSSLYILMAVPVKTNTLEAILLLKIALLTVCLAQPIFYLSAYLSR